MSFANKVNIPLHMELEQQKGNQETKYFTLSSQSM